MKTIAVQSYNELEKLTKAAKPESEKAVLAVLSVVAPKLTGYDVTASAEQKLRVLAAWRKKLAAS